MQGPSAEKFVVLNLRLLAVSFAVVGLLFIAVPSGVLDTISDLGNWIGSFPRAPHTQEDLWLALSFAYMVLITAICLVAQADVVRYRALILILAAGKTTSSLTALAFYIVDEHVFIYLLNFLVDGLLAVARCGSGRWPARSVAPPTPVDSGRQGFQPLSNAR